MLTITFDTDNAAYRVTPMDDEDPDLMPVHHDAVAESVESIAAAIRNGRIDGPVIDHNGNTVGRWSLTDSN